MQLLTILFTLFPLFRSVSSTTKEAKFTKSSEAANLVYSDHLLFDLPACSKLSCLELCATRCCIRFTYTAQRGTLGRCQGHSGWLSASEPGTSTPGAETYQLRLLEEGSEVPTNVALNKTATQSSNFSTNTVASKAVDGNLAAYFSSCSSTQFLEINWWQVDLGDGISGVGYDIVSIIITNRANCCPDRLRDFDIHVYSDDPATNPDAQGTLCAHHHGSFGEGVTAELTCCYGPIRGHFVRVTNTAGEGLTLCEVQVMAVPAV